MKPPALIVSLMVLSLACGPDKAMLMETKFDAPLRQKISSMAEKDPPQVLAVIGKCTVPVNAGMRRSLIEAGAGVQTIQGDIFTANVSSNDVFSVAALDFVLQIQLSKESKPQSR